MSQSVPRPMTGSAASMFLVRMISPPPARWVTWLRVKLIAASPVEEDADDMRRQRRQEGEGDGDVDVEPDFQERLELDLAPRALQRGVLALEQLQDMGERRGRRAALRTLEPRDRLARTAIAVGIRQTAPEAARNARLVERQTHDRRLLLVERLGGLQHAAVERADDLQHLLLRRLGAVLAQPARQARIHGDAEDARHDHQQHQAVSQGVDVPAELEARMQRDDDDQRQPEIDMRSEEH